MLNRIGQALLTVAFAGVIAAPALFAGPGAPASTSAAGSALDRHGFRFDEVSEAAGLVFTHTAPVLDSRLDHIMPLVAAMGASASVADFDRDGYPDIYVTNSGEGTRNALFRNAGDGTFVDVAAETGVADLNEAGHGCSTSSVWGDYDNDGFEDLLVCKWGTPTLFRNDGGRRFTKVEPTGLPSRVNANTAIWLDFDRDGHLDIFLAGFWDERFDLWNLSTTKVMSESFEYSRNGGRKYLFRGRGDGTFEDVTEKSELGSRRWTLAAGAADLFGSGWPDLFVANDFGVSEVYRNENGRFVDVSVATGIAERPKSGMNVSFGDLYGEGRLAVYVSNIAEEGILIHGNDLWVPRVSKRGVVATFRNMANRAGVELGGWSFGAQFGDLNNDGAIDIYLVNGYISADPGASYWYDYSKVVGGYTSIIADAANWPPMNGRSLSGYQTKRVWINDGTGRFTDVAQDVGVTDRLDGRAVALADLWNRGVLDAVVASQKGRVLLYRNTVRPGNAWIQLDLEGTASNRSAIGARVTVTRGGRLQVQEVHGGCGFSSQNDRRLHFGLGAGDAPADVHIRWPSGREQTLPGLVPGRPHRVKEPQ